MSVLNIIISASVFGIVGYYFMVCFLGYMQMEDKGNFQTENRLDFRPVAIRVFLVIAAMCLAIGYGRFFRMFQDIPQYLSGNYSVTEGTVTEIYANLKEGYLAKGTVEIEESKTREEMEFCEILIPFIKEGAYAKIAYLDHSKTGYFLKVNGINVGYEPHIGKAFFIVLLLLVEGFMYVYMLQVLTIPKSNRKKYRFFVYRNAYAYLLLGMEATICYGAILMIGSMFGNYSKQISNIWTCLLIVYHVGILIIFALGQQRLVLDNGKFTYCNFMQKCKGNVEDIQKLERTGKKMYIIMGDGTKLILNNIEDAFSERIQTLLGQ